MTDLQIAATQSSPSVATDWSAGTLEMRGDSYPENSWEFFAPILAGIKKHLEKGDRSLDVKLHLLYLNTSSVKAMIEIFDLLEAAHGREQRVSVRWYYDQENERIAELIEEFREDYTFPFEIIRT